MIVVRKVGTGEGRNEGGTDGRKTTCPFPSNCQPTISRHEVAICSALDFRIHSARRSQDPSRSAKPMVIRDVVGLREEVVTLNIPNLIVGVLPKSQTPLVLHITRGTSAFPANIEMASKFRRWNTGSTKQTSLEVF